MLDRDKAESLGLAFVHEGEAHSADPDIEVYTADLTVDGHTEHLQGKSEEDVLAQAERILAARGADLS